MSFSLKLDVSTSDMPCACSLCDLMMEKVKALQENFKSIESVEIHLFESVKEKLNGVTLSIRTASDTIVETCNARNWEDAVASTYENIAAYFRKHSFKK